MNEQPQKIDLSNIDWRSSREFFESLRGDFQRLEDATETYDFTWVGKKNAILEAGAPINKTLRPDLENSKNWDETENLFIEGDNLEALKLLQNSYLGKIKMIYIDPPYNTGKDFVYHDNFRQNVEEYDDSVERIDTNGNQNFKKNTRDGGRFHSDWLNMMFPRLKLAKNLLSEDGVIFISIDDNEQANLKKLCDEVFGEENFLASIIHQRAKGGGMAKNFVKAHDYIHVYAMDGSRVEIKQNKVIQQKVVERDGRQYIINNDIFRRGFGRKDRKVEHRCYFYEELVEIDSYKNDVIDGVMTGRYILQEYKPGKHLVARLEPVDEAFSKVYTIQKYLSEQGKITVDELMGENIFDFSKPVELVEFLVQISTQDRRDATVLDFFAGSATTAHAVMQLNAEDGGNRKWIMVQLPEETDEKSEAFKAGYKTIPEISRERIRRAGDKIAAENPNAKLDIGFRALKIDSSNQRDVSKTTEEISQVNLLDDAENIKDDRNQFDLLYGFLLASGMELSSKFEIEKVSGKDVLTYDYLGEGTGVVACFEKTNSEIIEKIAHKQPLVAVFRDSMFETSQEKINLMQQIKAVSPETEVKVV